MKYKRNKRFNFFISFSNQDKERAYFYFELLKEHYEVFFSPETIGPGEDWMNKIENAVLDSLTIIILYSSDTEDIGHYQKAEIQIAIAEERKKNLNIIPIQLEPDVNPPFGLSVYQGIQYFQTSDRFELLKLLSKNHNTFKLPVKDILPDFWYQSVMNETLKESRKDAYDFQSFDSRYGGSESRRLLQTKIEYELKEFLKSLANPFSLQIVFIDLDDFEKINKRYGIDFGNRVLNITEMIIKKNNPSFYLRLFGDEFVILFTNISLDEAYEKAKKIQESIHNYDWESRAKGAFVNSSAGISEIDDVKSRITIESKTFRKGLCSAYFGCQAAKRTPDKTKYGPIYVQEKDILTLKNLWKHVSSDDR